MRYRVMRETPDCRVSVVQGDLRVREALALERHLQSARPEDHYWPEVDVAASRKEYRMADGSQCTPAHLARLDAWIDAVHEIAQLSDAALAAVLEEEVGGQVALSQRQRTILDEVQDRLNGIPRVQTQETP